MSLWLVGTYRRESDAMWRPRAIVAAIITVAAVMRWPRWRPRSFLSVVVVISGLQMIARRVDRRRQFAFTFARTDWRRRGQRRVYCKRHNEYRRLRTDLYVSGVK